MKLLNKLKWTKITKASWLLPNLFVAIFLLAQVANTTHKAEHLNPNADNSCLLCINSVDTAIDIDSIVLNVVTVNLIQPETITVFVTDLAVELNYFSRAPPIA